MLKESFLETAFGDANRPFGKVSRHRLEQEAGIVLPSTLFELFRQLRGRLAPDAFFPILSGQGEPKDYLPNSFQLGDPFLAALHTSSCISWGLPIPMLTINRFEGHWCYALDYRNLASGQEPAVVYFDEPGAESYGFPLEETEDGTIILRLADSFDAFFDLLLSEDELKKFGLPSPYPWDL